MTLSNHSPGAGGLPKTTLRFNEDSELSKAVTSVLQFITGKGCRLESAKGRDKRDSVRERPGVSVQLSVPVESYGQCLIPPGTKCDDVHEVLPTREAHLNLGVQGFCWGSVT